MSYQKLSIINVLVGNHYECFLNFLKLTLSPNFYVNRPFDYSNNYNNNNKICSYFVYLLIVLYRQCLYYTVLYIFDLGNCHFLLFPLIILWKVRSNSPRISFAISDHVKSSGEFITDSLIP